MSVRNVSRDVLLDAVEQNQYFVGNACSCTWMVTEPCFQMCNRVIWYNQIVVVVNIITDQIDLSIC